VEVAVKMAYQYWQLTGNPKKTKFISLKNGYHGDTIGSVSVGGVDLFHARFQKLLFKGWQVEPHHPASGHLLPEGRRPTSLGPEPSPFRERGRGEGMEAILSRHHREVAAVVMEPLVQGASGMLLMPKGYLAYAARLCKEYKVLLIVDEVATGFGRTGTMFASEHEGVSPDFLCVAKSLTGGYLPLAATLTKERIYRAFLGRYDDFKTFFHGHTYTANPLACAVAIANLDLYKEKRLLEKLRHRNLQLAEGFKALKLHPHVKEVRQIGLMAGIELVQDKKTGKPYPPSRRMGLRVCDIAFKKGVWLRPLGDVVVVMPPLSISARELGFLTRIVCESVSEATTGDAEHSR
jgi:adenosylmethionine-8-amino-7-oxononanoate aminotransferase